MRINRFEELDVWQEARKLVNMVYSMIDAKRAFLADRRLTDQCIGAALSTMGTIPEGFARRSNREFMQYLFMSLSSAAELQSHLYIALDRKYIDELTFNTIRLQAEKIARMDSSLINYLRERDRRFRETKKTKETKQTRETN